MNSTREVQPPTGSLRASGRGRLWVATVMWTAFILRVTVERSFPGISPGVTVVLQVIGLGAAVWVIFISPREASDRGSARLMRAFAIVPIVAAALALYRGDPADAIAHLASVVALIAAARMDVQSRALSVWHALFSLITASLVLGAVRPASLVPSSRTLLAPLYNGRLAGLLESPNVLGQCCALLLVLSLITQTGRTRRWGVFIALFALIASASQTGALASAAALLVYGTVIVSRRGRKDAVVLAYLAFCSIVIVGLFWFFTYAHPQPLDFSQVTFSHRRDVWDMLLRQHIPFIGLGQSQLETIYANSNITGAVGIDSAHNAVLDAYVRDGVPGLAALAAMLVVLLVTVERQRSGLVLVPLAVFVVEGMMEVSPTHVPLYAIYFTLFTAALFAAADARTVEEPLPVREDLRAGKLVPTRGVR